MVVYFVPYPFVGLGKINQAPKRRQPCWESALSLSSDSMFLFLSPPVCPQIVLGTVVSVQMDLAGQHRVQVVGHIPSGLVELTHCFSYHRLSICLCVSPKFWLVAG